MPSSRIRGELTAFLLTVACRLLLPPSYRNVRKGESDPSRVYFMVISPRRLYFSSYRSKHWRRSENLGNPSSKTDDDAFPLFG